MIENYVTLLDANFLPQGLALHRSLERIGSPFLLWVLCVDEAAFKILESLDLPDVRPLNLLKLETEELMRLRRERTRAEYCWTLTPFAPRFVFEANISIKRVTYVDADLWFKRKPDPIFKELKDSGKSVLITEHAYYAPFDMSDTSGLYCVQFVTFIRGESEVVRLDWERKCVDWCFNRVEDGLFGDQKYLDDWPLRFSEQVHVLQDKEVALAPWNVLRYPSGRGIFYHFHGLRLSKIGLLSGSYPIPRPVIFAFYNPYKNDLHLSKELLKKAGHKVLMQGDAMLAMRQLVGRIKRIFLFLGMSWPIL